MHVCMYAYVCVCIYICMYIYLSVYIHTHTTDTPHTTHTHIHRSATAASTFGIVITGAKTIIINAAASTPPRARALMLWAAEHHKIV